MGQRLRIILSREKAIESGWLGWPGGLGWAVRWLYEERKKIDCFSLPAFTGVIYQQWTARGVGRRSEKRQKGGSCQLWCVCVNNCLDLRSPSAAEQTIYLSICRTAAPHYHEPINGTKQLFLSCGAMRESAWPGPTSTIQSIGPHGVDCTSTVVDFLKLTIRVLFNVTTPPTRSIIPGAVCPGRPTARAGPWIVSRAPILASWSELTTV